MLFQHTLVCVDTASHLLCVCICLASKLTKTLPSSDTALPVQLLSEVSPKFLKQIFHLLLMCICFLSTPQDNVWGANYLKLQYSHPCLSHCPLLLL